jgi:hypothetical protein
VCVCACVPRIYIYHILDMRGMFCLLKRMHCSRFVCQVEFWSKFTKKKGILVAVRIVVVLEPAPIA